MSKPIETKELMTLFMMLHSLRRIAMARIPVETKVNWSQMPMLRYVEIHPGCSQVEIADKMMVSPASVALSTKRMQKAGLIEKRVDEYNLRKNMLYLTEFGKEVTRQCGKRFESIDEQMLIGFTDEEKGVLEKYLKRMIMNYNSKILDRPVDFLDMRAMEQEAQQRAEEENDDE